MKTMENQTRNSAVILLMILFSLISIESRATDAKGFIDLFVAQVNKECPIKLDDGIVMEKCEQKGEKTIGFYFNLSDRVAKNIKRDGVSKKAAVESLKSSPVISIIKELEISFLYIYNDSDGKMIEEMTITPKDYA